MLRRLAVSSRLSLGKYHPYWYCRHQVRLFHWSNGCLDTERPWYQKESFNEQSLAPLDLPEVPDKCPEFVETSLEFLARDLGLTDLAIIDARDAMSIPALMIVGTGTSQKHLGAAAQELSSYLKKSYGILAQKSGMLTSNFLKVYHRRQHRRAQHQRMASTVEPLSRTDPWVVLDTRQGVLFHMMTADRRDSLDLEGLFNEPEGTDVSPKIYEEFLPPRSSSNGQPNGQSNGRRSFHSTARAFQNKTPLEYISRLEESGEVNETLAAEFTAIFPPVLSRQDWRLRLGYFSVAASLGDRQFLKLLLEEAKAQQASGYVLDRYDIERVMSGIAYNGQTEFSKKPVNKETVKEWHDLCDLKANLILELQGFACETAGQKFTTDPRILVLLYRAFVAPSLGDGKPFSSGLFWDPRQKTLVSTILESDEILKMPVLRMILNTLAVGRTWSTFWRVIDSIQVRAVLKVSMVEEIAGITVRGQETSQIDHLVQNFLPSVLLHHKLPVTPRLEQLVQEGLKIIDPEDLSYMPIRRLLHRS